MKVEIKEQPQQIELKYPYVGRSSETGNVVLFIKPRTGIALFHIFKNPGFYLDDWGEENLTPLPLTP